MVNDEMNLPKLFYMIRHKDVTGISGTGRVLDGVIFSTGQVVICWRKPDKKENPHAHSSIAIYDSLDAFRDIHVHNGSEIVFIE